MIFNFLLCVFIIQLTICQQFYYKLQQKQKIDERIQSRFSLQQKSRISTLQNDETHFKNRLCQVYNRNKMRAEVVDKRALNKKQQESHKSGIIYKISDIQQIKYVQDMVYYKNTIIVLFQNLQLSYYSLQKQGELVSMGAYVLPQQIKGTNKLIANDDNCISICGDNAYVMNDMKWSKMSGYRNVGQYFRTAKLYKQQLIVVAGSKGIYHYKITNNQQLQLTSSYILKLNEQIVSPLDLDISMNTYYVVDEQKGLLKYNKGQILNNNNNNSIQVKQTQIKLKGCKYVFVHHQHILLQCAHFLIYNTKNNQINIQANLNMYPRQIIKNNSNLIYIGNDDFGVSQNIQLGIQKGQIFQNIHKTVLYGQYLVSVNEFSIWSWKYEEPDYYIKCEAQGDKKMIQGNNTGTLTMTGVCERKKMQFCVEQEIVVVQVDFPTSYHVFQIVGSVMFLWLSCFCGIWLSVRHIKVRKQYYELQEDATVVDLSKNDMQISYQTNITNEDNNSGINNPDLQNNENLDTPYTKQKVEKEEELSKSFEQKEQQQGVEQEYKKQQSQEQEDEVSVEVEEQENKQ